MELVKSPQEIFLFWGHDIDVLKYYVFNEKVENDVFHRGMENSMMTDILNEGP